MNRFSPRGTRRVFVQVTAVLATAGLLGGCASSAPEQASNAEAISTDFIPGTFDQSISDLLPAEIASAGEVTVASEVGYPPFELYADDQKTIVGADIELLRAVGDVIGITMNFTDIKFDSIIPGLQTNRYDLAGSAFGITPDRLKAVDFVSYFSGGTSLIVPSGNPKAIDLESMCGRSIAVQKGTVYSDDYLPKFSSDCEAAGKEAIKVGVYQAQPEATLAVSTGRAEASMSDYGPLAYVVKRSNGQLEVLEQNYDPSTYGFAFPKDSKLAPAIAEAINVLIADGTYLKILQKWEIQGGAVAESTVNR